MRETPDALRRQCNNIYHIDRDPSERAALIMLAKEVLDNYEQQKRITRELLLELFIILDNGL